MTQADVPIVLQPINGFSKNLNFTLDTFKDKKKLHFLDLLIAKVLQTYFKKTSILVNMPVIIVICLLENQIDLK